MRLRIGDRKKEEEEDDEILFLCLAKSNRQWMNKWMNEWINVVVQITAALIRVVVFRSIGEWTR